MVWSLTGFPLIYCKCFCNSATVTISAKNKRGMREIMHNLFKFIFTKMFQFRVREHRISFAHAAALLLNRHTQANSHHHVRSIHLFQTTARLCRPVMRYVYYAYHSYYTYSRARERESISLHTYYSFVTTFINGERVARGGSSGWRGLQHKFKFTFVRIPSYMPHNSHCRWRFWRRTCKTHIRNINFQALSDLFNPVWGSRTILPPHKYIHTAKAY